MYGILTYIRLIFDSSNPTDPIGTCYNVTPRAWSLDPFWKGRMYTAWWLNTTHLKNISQIGNLHQIGMNIKNDWNNHLVYSSTSSQLGSTGKSENISPEIHNKMGVVPFLKVTSYTFLKLINISWNQMEWIYFPNTKSTWTSHVLCFYFLPSKIINDKPSAFVFSQSFRTDPFVSRSGHLGILPHAWGWAMDSMALGYTPED